MYRGFFNSETVLRSGRGDLSTTNGVGSFRFSAWKADKDLTMARPLVATDVVEAAVDGNRC